jgi:hypothetical protein
MTALSLIPLSAMDASMEWDSKWNELMNDVKAFGADLALGASDEAPTGLHPSGFDQGYGLGFTVPRTMNRVSFALATAVILALLPVSIWAWATSAAPDRSPSRSAQHATVQGAGRGTGFAK